MKDVLLTLAAALVGWLSSQAANYFWLTKPRPKLSVLISGESKGEIANYQRRFSYTVILTFSNYSDNEAFGFRPTKIVFVDKRLGNPSTLVFSKKLLTKSIPTEYQFEIGAIIHLLPNMYHFSLSQAFDILNKGIKVYVAFENKLGKQYKRSYNTIMEFKEDNFVVL